MDVLEQVRELIKPQYDKLECWVHRWPHIEDVAENAKKLAELENADVNSCIIAAYCHDLGRIEEEERKRRGDLPLPHALLSIEPTIRVLQKVGISGVSFDEIVEAIAVHSYRDYNGNNTVARILRDADKISSGFGPYRILTVIKYSGGVDYVAPKEIVDNKENLEKVRELCEISLNQLNGSVLEKTRRGLDFVMEWLDMFHTKSAKTLIKKEEYEYFMKCKEFLAKKF